MEYAGIGVIALIVGLGEMFKKIGFPPKYLPLVDLGLGLVAGTLLIQPNDIKSGIVQGLYIGLSASGLFSGAKHIAMSKEKYNATHNK
ncbi:hypothetical protein MHBO_001012 [Bonamia ostreae]|uniref:Holin n=1 Tax=Bonamia ostreae TaxID=126728 RepID=A0ABV2AIF0_9EUKA